MHKGGLGLDNLLTRNISLLFKWWWNGFMKENGYWWNIIKQKYQLFSYQGLNQCGGLSNMFYIMKDICAPHNLQQWSSSFSEHAHRWFLGDGEKILFWEDSWHDEIASAERFPRLYSLSKWKYCSVKLIVTMWQKANIPRWTRTLRAWELDLEVEISNIVDNLVLNNSKDLVV